MGSDTPVWEERAKAREKKQWDAARSSTNIQKLQRFLGLELGIPNTFCEAKGPIFRLRTRNQNWRTNLDIQVPEGLITSAKSVNTMLKVYDRMIPKIYASGSSRKRL